MKKQMTRRVSIPSHQPMSPTTVFLRYSVSEASNSNIYDFKIEMQQPIQVFQLGENSVAIRVTGDFEVVDLLNAMRDLATTHCPNEDEMAQADPNLVNPMYNIFHGS